MVRIRRQGFYLTSVIFALFLRSYSVFPCSAPSSSMYVEPTGLDRARLASFPVTTTFVHDRDRQWYSWDCCGDTESAIEDTGRDGYDLLDMTSVIVDDWHIGQLCRAFAKSQATCLSQRCALVDQVECIDDSSVARHVMIPKQASTLSARGYDR